MLKRDRNRGLDPHTDFHRIYRNLTLYEFPWDYTQSLSFALFRTYAVPSVGRLLYDTSAFTEDTQKRYDDTALLLEQPLIHGFASEQGKGAIRRINQMHRAYDITNDDMLYVLSTFVVVPKRWIDDYGWRKLSYDEVVASVNYYRTLGKHMNIKGIPETYDAFAELMDSYEQQHFAYDEGGRKVADATMELLTTFYPKPFRKAVKIFSIALLDEPLRIAFRYDDPGALLRKASHAAMRARGRFVALLPSRIKEKRVQDMPRIQSYPDGFTIEQMGTFPQGCPISHGRGTEAKAETGAADPAKAS